MMSSEVMSGSVKHTYRTSSIIFTRKTPTLVRMDFRERLTAAMKRANVNGAELGRAIGVTSQAISLILSGTSRALTAENTAKAARFLKVDHYWLATGEGHITTPPQGEALGITPEALSIAKWFDRLTDARDRARVETAVMAAILRALQERDLPPNGVPDGDSGPGTPPAPIPPRAPADPPTPARTHSGPDAPPKRRGR
jgi:transcriptional regulator with XRE-family HTH domain